MQQIQRYFRKAGKALARFFGRVKKGSPIDIAILVCAAALVIALLAILVMSLLPDAAPVDGLLVRTELSSSVSASQSGSYDPDAGRGWINRPTTAPSCRRLRTAARRTLTKRCFWAIPTPTVWCLRPDNVAE